MEGLQYSELHVSLKSTPNFLILIKEFHQNFVKGHLQDFQFTLLITVQLYPEKVIQMQLLLIQSLQVSLDTILKVRILNPFKMNDVEHRNYLTHVN